MSDEQDDKIKQAVETARLNGASATTVEDGHVIIFTKAKLQELITAAESTSREMVILVIKRPDFETTNKNRITH